MTKEQLPERDPWHMTHVIHKSCGSHVGWIVLSENRPVEFVELEHFMRVDGTYFDTSKPFQETCGRCGAKIDGAGDMAIKKFPPLPLG